MRSQLSDLGAQLCELGAQTSVHLGVPSVQLGKLRPCVLFCVRPQVRIPSPHVQFQVQESNCAKHQQRPDSSCQGGYKKERLRVAYPKSQAQARQDPGGDLEGAETAERKISHGMLGVYI